MMAPGQGPLAYLFGMPAHPLMVHAAVVLVPLAAVALIAVGWNRAWRHQYYLPIMLVSVGGAFGAFLAQQTGSTLKHALRAAGKPVGPHPGQGNTAFVLAGLLAAVCIGLWMYESYGERIRDGLGFTDRYRLPFDENLTLYVVAVPVALLAIVTMVMAGHSGATLVWRTYGIVTPVAVPTP